MGGSWDIHADRQTNKQTSSSQYSAPLLGHSNKLCNLSSRITQPCIPPGSLNWVPAFTGWGKGGKEFYLCRAAGNTVWSHMAREFPQRRGMLRTAIPSYNTLLYMYCSVTVSGRRTTFSCTFDSLRSTGQRIPSRHSLSSCYLTMLGLCPPAAHRRAAELLRKVHRGDVVERQSRLEAEMSTARHDPTAAKLVVEVDITAVWSVSGSACRWSITTAWRCLQTNSWLIFPFNKCYY